LTLIIGCWEGLLIVLSGGSEIVTVLESLFVIAPFFFFEPKFPAPRKKNRREDCLLILFASASTLGGLLEETSASEVTWRHHISVQRGKKHKDGGKVYNYHMNLI
jgi:hypothetical protein